MSTSGEHVSTEVVTQRLTLAHNVPQKWSHSAVRMPTGSEHVATKVVMQRLTLAYVVLHASVAVDNSPEMPAAHRLPEIPPDRIEGGARTDLSE